MLFIDLNIHCFFRFARFQKIINILLKGSFSIENSLPLLNGAKLSNEYVIDF